jgi:hypothetical protein
MASIFPGLKVCDARTILEPEAISVSHEVFCGGLNGREITKFCEPQYAQDDASNANGGRWTAARNSNQT